DRYVLVFNGEIYNHAELRKKLLGDDPDLNFRGHSDTEILLAAICAWGLRSALQAANGMFAIALWDRTTNTLSLDRDRMGEKPLYYGRFRETLLFGSDLKALRQHPRFDAAINRHAL